jgi:hypothetical protein
MARTKTEPTLRRPQRRVSADPGGSTREEFAEQLGLAVAVAAAARLSFAPPELSLRLQVVQGLLHAYLRATPTRVGIEPAA